MKRIWIAVAILSILLAACGAGTSDGGTVAVETTSGDQTTEGSSTTTTGVATDRPSVLVLFPSLEDESYVRMSAAAEEAAKAFSDVADVSVQAGAGRSAATDLIGKIETAVTTGVDVIAINAGATSKEILPAVENAIAQGVKIVGFDAVLDVPGVSSSITFDAFEANVEAGEFMVEQLGGDGEVGIIYCFQGHPQMIPRSGGFVWGLTDTGVEVVAEGDARCDAASARTIAENMLTAHPNLGGIYGDTDVANVGVYEALKAAGKDLVLIGHDAQTFALEKIAAGDIYDATINMNYETFGTIAVETAVAVALGEDVESQIRLPAQPLVTRDIAQELLAQINAEQ